MAHEIVELEERAVPSPILQPDISIAGVDTARPIQLPALVHIETGPVVLSDLNPPGSIKSFAETAEASPEAPALAIGQPHRVARAQPTGGNAAARARSLDFANSAGAQADQRAYIPQISQSDRQAYIAQLDLANPQHRLAVRIDGEIVGALQFEVSQGRVAVHIGQVLDLFESQMEPSRFAALRGSQAAHAFIPLEKIRAAGIPLEYDAAYDELVLARSSG